MRPETAFDQGLAFQRVTHDSFACSVSPKACTDIHLQVESNIFETSGHAVPYSQGAVFSEGFISRLHPVTVANRQGLHLNIPSA